MLQINNDYNYHFGLHATADALDALNPDWNDLIARSGQGTTPFQTPEWCMSWLELNPEAEPLVITIHENSRLVFLTPLMQVKSLPGVRALAFLTSPECKYGNVLCDVDKDIDALFQDCVAYLQDENICDLLLLNDISRQQKWLRRYDELLTTSELKYSSILNIKHCTDGGFYQSLSKALRRDIRLTRSRLEQMGHLTIEVTDCDKAWLEDVLPKLMHWKKAWLKHTGRWGNRIFNGNFQKFVSAFVSRQNTGTLRARSCTIRLDGEILTADIHFVQNGVVFGYFSSFDPTIEKVSLGTLRDFHLIEWLAENNGHSFDLLGYPERYKERMTNHRQELVNLHLALNLRGRIANAIVRFDLRNLAKALYYKFPARWRKAAMQVLRR